MSTASESTRSQNLGQDLGLGVERVQGHRAWGQDVRLGVISAPQGGDQGPWIEGSEVIDNP